MALSYPVDSLICTGDQFMTSRHKESVRGIVINRTRVFFQEHNTFCSSISSLLSVISFVDFSPPKHTLRILIINGNIVIIPGYINNQGEELVHAELS